MTVVIGYTSTPEGRQALASGMEEALLRKTSLLIVNIDRSHHDLDDEEQQSMREQLSAVGMDLHIESSVLADPGDRLIQVAQQHGSRLIVLGIRHRSMVGKLLLGSTAQRVILEATCPVMAVKAPAC
ncbi:universal stress protein [Arthrobacter mobilis]|uniref:Universal stress protein n=1 Tax=Arthrobacter mobilis TaxID=2724944 RepID=A0A7X6QM58_9MICC|nr:universal stress protein [Arthrobacter mobilis]NKX56404.1 universal stress protein [Arthrobacter mobilis]